MTGLKTKRLVWTVVFLGITLTAIVMECVAGLFHPAGTIPWTEYLARYVPWPFQLIAYVTLATWLPFHFWRHDHLRKVAYDQGARLERRRLTMPRCPNCDHTTTMHSIGTCWFTVSHGSPGANLVCPCVTDGH